MGAWVEMEFFIKIIIENPSLPSWERGLKSFIIRCYRVRLVVAPLVGAWVEIKLCCFISEHENWVAPLVGAWVEIYAIKAA